MPQTDNICSMVMYKLFPNSNRAIDNEIRQIEKDLDKLYSERREAQSIANELKETLTKLNNTKISMDPNGMTRADAITSTQKKAMIVLKKIKGLHNQISLFEGSKYTMEKSLMATDMKKRISLLHDRMKRVQNVNTDELEDNIDDIADMNDHIEKINTTIHDTMVSAWTVDMDSDEAMLQEFLEQSDDADDTEKIVHALPVDPVKTHTPISMPRLSRNTTTLTPIKELF
jgi:chromosome segregation ATPase